MNAQKEFLPYRGIKVCLEIIVAGLIGRSVLQYSVTRHYISDMEGDPDQLVVNFLQNPKFKHPKLPLDHCIIHSTSWRYERNKTLILTYIVYSDSVVFNNEACQMLNLKEKHIPEGSTPARPRPQEITDSHVVWHGILHISHLVQRDKTMRKILNDTTLLAFQSMGSALAGRLC